MAGKHPLCPGAVAVAAVVIDINIDINSGSLAPSSFSYLIYSEACPWIASHHSKAPKGIKEGICANDSQDEHIFQ